MIQKKIFTFVIIFCTVWSLSGCNENTLDPIRSTGDPNGNDQLYYFITSPDNVTMISDSGYVGQPMIFHGRSQIAGIYMWIFTFGDGTTDSSSNGNVLKKYVAPGTYVPTLRVRYGNNQSQLATGNPLRIVNSTSGLKPILKVLHAVNVGNGNWDVTYGFLRRAATIGGCTFTPQPFVVFTVQNGISSWNPINLSLDTTSDGYYRHTERIQNNSQRSCTYGLKFPQCWAWITPNPGEWSSGYYYADSTKLCFYFRSGELFPLNTISSPAPGEFGDTGPNPVVRFSIIRGLTSDKDTIVTFFSRARVANSQTSPFHVNNVTGMNSPQLIVPATNFEDDWWMYKMSRNVVPPSMTITADYGGNYSAASYADLTGSFFLIVQNGWLEYRLYEIGGRISEIRVLR